MKVDRISKTIIGDQEYWLIEHSGIGAHVQRTGIRSASDSPLSDKEELICALCEKIKEQTP